MLDDQHRGSHVPREAGCGGLDTGSNSRKDHNQSLPYRHRLDQEREEGLLKSEILLWLVHVQPLLHAYSPRWGQAYQTDAGERKHLHPAPAYLFMVMPAATPPRNLDRVTLET